MNRKLYVGNLPFSATEEMLETFFAKAGQVETVRIVRDKYSDRSRGFGFVEMGNEQDCERAIEELNGTDLDGRPLRISLARERTDRPQHGGGGFGRGPRRGGRGGGGGFRRGPRF